MKYFRLSTLLSLIVFALLGWIGCQSLLRVPPTPVPGVALPFEVILHEAAGYNPQVVVFYQEEFKAYVANSPEDIQQLLTMIQPQVAQNLSLNTKLRNISLQDAFVLALFRRQGSSSCDVFDIREIKQDQGQIFVIVDAMERQGEECLATITHRVEIVKVKREPSDLKPQSEDVVIIPRYYGKNQSNR
jgi:hypothetical protein